MPDYPLHQRTLGNGLRVIVSPDHASPAVAVNLWYDVGSRDERAAEPGRGNTGFAHLFEHLMFQGSRHVEASQHIALMQSAGASVNATTWFDRTNYFETLPIGGLDLALWLEADRMAYLLDAVGQENLDNQREVVKEEKRQRYDNVPYGDAMQHLGSLVFPADHPYGHTTIGSMADLDAATLDDVHEFFRTHYMPNNAVLTLVGDLSPEDGFAAAEKFFGHIPAGERPERPVQEPLRPLTGSPRLDLDADVPANALYLGWRLPARGTVEQDACDLALEILGAGQTSRLHQRLVRDQELAQGAGAQCLALIGGNSFGLALARGRDGVEPAALQEGLFTEIDRLREDGPTDEEVRRVRNQSERGWLQALAHLETRADQISAHALLLNDAELVNRRLSQLNSIDAEAITAAARTWLAPESAALVSYRSTQPDTDQPEPQLEEASA